MTSSQVLDTLDSVPHKHAKIEVQTRYSEVDNVNGSTTRCSKVDNVNKCWGYWAGVDVTCEDDLECQEIDAIVVEWKVCDEVM